MNRSKLAAAAQLDRSTLSQLLMPATDRLPRGDTVAEVAAVLKVSTDWLLGLSGEARPGAAVLQESLQIARHDQTLVDSDLARWHREAAGYKIRYVPATLPDLLKTAEIIQYEFRDYVSKTADQALVSSKLKLDYVRLPETDIEICMSQQSLESFARGEGIWHGMHRDARLRQLQHMEQLIDQQYPSLRVYLFDGLNQFSAPYTVFGPQRAAIFVGQLYFVFTTTEHVRALTEHFDALIRAAVVQANELPEYLRQLVAAT